MTNIQFRLRAAAGALGAVVMTIALLTGAPSTAREADAPTPTLWRITDSDSTLWIFGAVHMLPPSLKWRRPALDTALAKAQIVYFEAPVQSVTPAGYAALLEKYGYNPSGVRLTQLLDVDTRKMYTRVATKLMGGVDSLERQKPWLAALTLSWIIAQQTGAASDAGVDNVLERAAKAAGKDVRYLETVEFQMQIFADISIADQVASLRATLVEYETKPKQFEKLVAAWRSGDDAKLAKLISGSMANLPPIIYKRLFSKRNAVWAAQIAREMQGDGVILVVVGAGHLVGEGSLIELLAKRGYAPERM
ncbi:MAG: TraB/GumN family protein [Neomegalonema sp.]|nr:TraB/GumN family protein [Neomegalonema sp.]